jgi:hypothetical protein
VGTTDALGTLFCYACKSQPHKASAPPTDRAQNSGWPTPKIVVRASYESKFVANYIYTQEVCTSIIIHSWPEAQIPRGGTCRFGIFRFGFANMNEKITFRATRVIPSVIHRALVARNNVAERVTGKGSGRIVTKNLRIKGQQ